MFSQIYQRTLDGQKITINPNSNCVVFEITYPFMTAGDKLGWKKEYGMPGFGINKAIIKFIESRKSRLLIHVLSNPNQKKYWITHEKLKNFIKNNRSEYQISGKTIHVIPWSIFTAKPSFSGVK